MIASFVERKSAKKQNGGAFMSRGPKVLLTIAAAIVWILILLLFRVLWIPTPGNGLALGTRVALFIATFSNIRIAAIVVGLFGLAVQASLITLLVVSIRAVWRKKKAEALPEPQESKNVSSPSP
jgi:uncharacterized membrane protein